MQENFPLCLYANPEQFQVAGCLKEPLFVQGLVLKTVRVQSNATAYEAFSQPDMK
jgi:hypothetical protein